MNMIVYHVTTMYQLLYIICHRLTVNRDEQCCLFITEYLLPEMQNGELFEKLNDNRWFDSITVIPEASFKLARGGALDENSSDREIDAVIENISNTFEKWVDFDFYKAKAIYVASDQWSLGVYLLHNRIPYIYIEDGSGMLSQQERYLNITKKFSLSNYIICNRLCGAGRSDVVTACLCDLKNQTAGFYDKRAVDFSIYDAVSAMPDTVKAALFDFYGITSITVHNSEKTCLFLTQFLQTLAKNELKTQEMLSTLLVDYFADGYHIMVKPHPKDKWLDYSRVFPECEIVPREINAELLPFVFDRPPKTAVTISSTAIGGLSEYVSRTISLGTGVETSPEILHVYYALAQILKRLDVQGDIDYCGVDKTAADCFVNAFGALGGKNKIKALIDSGVCESDRSDTSGYGLCVYLNTAHYSNDVREAKLADMIEVLVKVSYDDFDRPTYYHRMYVKCKSDEMIKKLSELKINRRLKYTRADCNIFAHKMTETEISSLCERYNKIKRSYMHEIQISGVRTRET
ncbi:MAG: hypothetical protein ACI396_03200, partial [Acutalibacteraceae bacterium]